MAPTPDQKLHQLEWKESWQGQRLKQIILADLPGLSSRNALLVIRNGLVRGVGSDVPLDDADMPVPAGTNLTVDLRHGVHGRGEANRPRLHERMQVVYDDPWVVVVNKQSGTPVQPIEDDDYGAEDGNRPKGAPLVELLKHYWKQQRQPIVNPYLVQRLDLETSGLLVLAKTDVVAAALQRQLQPPRALKRRYLALVAGVMVADKGQWRSRVGRGKTGLRQSMAQGSKAKAQLAVTHFTVRERFANATLVAFELETGRTHQIRIHSAEAGHPVLGEVLYRRHATHAHEFLNENPTKPLAPGHPHNEAREVFARPKPPAPPDAPRILLHSTELSFVHPETGRRLTYRQDPPEDFQAILAALRSSKSSSA
jgi:23S rRNA pseudouridine1911/1915/1917 synthase